MKKHRYRFVPIVALCLFLFPTMTSANVGTLELPLHSESAILIDGESGQVLFDKSSQTQLSPASITKIATSIYAIENGDLEEIVTVSENARHVDGTKVYLEAGEQVPLLTLVQGLMINSGNDAGVAIAEYLSGSLEAFVIDFNEFLQEEIGVENTYFANPHGLYHPDHLTTAEDMAKITQYAMKNEIFREIFNTSELVWDGETWDTTIINHHAMVRDKSYEGITGGKNGYVSEAGFTLVTTAEQDNLSLIAVTLNAESDKQTYEDTTALFDYGFQHFQTEKIDRNVQYEDTDENTYVTNQEIIYTKRIGETVEEEVLPSGMLIIKGENGETIQEQKLVQVGSQKKDEQMKSEVVASPSTDYEMNAEDHLRIIVPLAIVISFLISGLFIAQVRRI